MILTTVKSLLSSSKWNPSKYTNSGTATTSKNQGFSDLGTIQVATLGSPCHSSGERHHCCVFNQLDDQERWLNLKKALDSSEKCPQSDYTGDSREGQAMTLQFVSSEAPMNHAQGPHLQSSYRAPAKHVEEYPTSHKQWPLWSWPKRESLGKFPSHKRYCSYAVEKGNVLGWQLNDEAHNEHRALLFYICNVLCLS